MDFLENVMSVVGSAAQNVVKKSGEVVGYSKIKHAMYSVSSEIKQLKEEIGQAVYDSYKNNTPLDEIVKEKCAQIDKLNEQLQEYNNQLNNYRSMVKCPSCGSSVKDESNFCPECGARLAVDKEAEVNETQYYTVPQTEPQSEPVSEESAAE